MVDFTLTEEQKGLREMAHDFATREIRPVAWEYDRDATWPQAIIERAWEVGLMNPHIPEEYGGSGASAMDAVLIEEELGWGGGPRPSARSAEHAANIRTGNYSGGSVFVIPARVAPAAPRSSRRRQRVQRAR